MYMHLKLRVCQFFGFAALAAKIAPEVPIKPIPTIPITVAIPVWFSPSSGSPVTITRAPITHNVNPNANTT